MVKLIEKIATEHKVVAFTFDDGPDAQFTRQILNIFRKVNGKATFFMIGEQMDANEEIAREVYEAGHEIGNHTYSHPDLTTLPMEQVASELQKMHERIHQLTGQSPISFRPPFFQINASIAELATNAGYAMISACNTGARDWEQPQPSVDFMVTQTKEVTQAGSVFIFHDGYGDRTNTVEAVSILVDALHAEGYRFVTISELISLSKD
ncbi:peptidoglycan/xylan/chitin deacetylase (PgdA/CDA1 family) [Paenibacillus turicensis]|uniref:Peptidoglycan/xylan/chitin deacetylase (PgdA/CDA1 family) n=1 Tax=Paenibacillus turicensis TaxID=160487 RepID=A0ABS4FQG9_9BACL|nr:polysaccharide deacetylase family protein [Paenibacillus turicensis]MBP1904634.1 peptidoglycan/xylan/chitin deacetylase (PgdA/CDA1 family) [Paenibacillus turicensis]